MGGRIGVVTTGGTIGATLKGSLNVDPDGAALRDQLQALAAHHGAELVIREAINKISEDIEPSDWAPILMLVEELLAEGVDRVVVTHGTDTLSYTSAAMSFAFGARKARICLTGAFLRLDHPQSDVRVNLLAAFEAVLSDALPTGVYVAFRADAEANSVQIIAGLDIKPMRFDDLVFSARYDLPVAVYRVGEGLTLSPVQGEHIDLVLGGALPTAEQLRGVAGKVLLLQVQPGLDLKALLPHAGLPAVIVMELYHSGTGPSEDGENSLLGFVKSNPDRLFLLSPYASSYLEAPYESTVRLMRAGARVYRDLQPYQLQVLALMALALGKPSAELLDKLSPWEIRLSASGGIDFTTGSIRQLP